MMTLRTLEGAWKCALRDFLREECSAVDVCRQPGSDPEDEGSIHVLIFVIAATLNFHLCLKVSNR